MGLVQTLTLARVLSPEWFSLFILVGAIGYSLWLCDLGPPRSCSSSCAQRIWPLRPTEAPRRGPRP